MRIGKTNLLSLFCALVLASGMAASGAGQERTTAGAAARTAPSASVNTAQGEKPPTVVIPLSNVGFADWDFLNPRRPKAIPVGADLEFRNGTADRTITITIPISFNLNESVLVYPVSSKLGTARAEVRYGVVALSADRPQAVKILKNPTAETIDAIVRDSQFRAAVAASDAIFELLSLREALRTPAPGTQIDKLIGVSHKAAVRYGLKCSCELPKSTPIEHDHVPDGKGNLAIENYEWSMAGNEVKPSNEPKEDERQKPETFADGWPMVRPGTEEVGSSVLQLSIIDDAVAHIDRSVKCISTQCDPNATCGGECTRNGGSVQALADAIAKQIAKLGPDLQAAEANAASAVARAKKWKNLEEKAKLDGELKDLQDYAREERTIVAALTKASKSIGLQHRPDPTVLLADRAGAASLADCATANGKLTCSATQTANPGQSVIFPHSILELDRKQILQAKAKFFDETQAPSNPTAYLIEAGQVPDDRPPEGSFGLNAGVGGVYEPFVDKHTVDFGVPRCANLCPANPLDTQHDSHYKASGRLDVTRTLSYFADASVSMKFQGGDFGGNPDTTTKFAASQYIFKAYSQEGVIFQFGRFDFAVPSTSISINESGEGFNFSYLNYSAGWEVKRESDAFTPNSENRDSYAAIFAAKNLPLTSSFARSFDLTAVYGNDRKKDSTVPVELDAQGTPVRSLVTRTAHKYMSYGGELFYAVPPAAVQGSVAAYRATRNAATSSDDCANANIVCDGRGAVGLMTVTKSFINPKTQKADRLFNLYIGMGTGDNPKTPQLNEAYIGETPGFAPDLIFLSKLSSSISALNPTPKATPPVLDAKGQPIKIIENGPLGLGQGLSGKRYIGFQFIDNTFSPLEMFATAVFRIPKDDVKSRSTTITLNDYHLREPFLGSKTAGREIDIQFAAETPKNVKVSVGAGYFLPGSAVKTIIRKNAWLLQANISISL